MIKEGVTEEGVIEEGEGAGVGGVGGTKARIMIRKRQNRVVFRRREVRVLKDQRRNGSARVKGGVKTPPLPLVTNSDLPRAASTGPKFADFRT